MGVPIINGYYCVEKISNGSFGQVWKAIKKESFNNYNYNKKDNEVAIKIEKKERNSQLKNEYAVLSSIHTSLRITPHIFHFGETPTSNYMVFELLGQSIDKYYQGACKNISNTDVNISSILKRIGSQMLYCIQSLHKCGIIHRDIKPQNFLLSNDNRDIYIIDFGLSTSYIDRKKHHIPITYQDSAIGTIDFISYYLHEGLSASRRDDLISMVYVIIYIYNGILPWQKEGLKTIYEIKYNISPQRLCQGMSDKINIMLVYCYGLEYAAEPNYEYIRFLFETM